MPYAAPTPCCYPGCPETTPSRYCETHLKQTRKADDKRRGSAASRGYGHSWRKARKIFLGQHPLCECQECQAGKVRIRAATVVDHKIPHKGNMVLFWDCNNWQSMARSCHDKKTAKEDGGFGREVVKR